MVNSRLCDTTRLAFCSVGKPRFFEILKCDCESPRRLRDKKETTLRENRSLNKLSCETVWHLTKIFRDSSIFLQDRLPPFGQGQWILFQVRTVCKLWKTKMSLIVNYLMIAYIFHLSKLDQNKHEALKRNSFKLKYHPTFQLLMYLFSIHLNNRSYTQCRHHQMMKNSSKWSKRCDPHAAIHI